MFKFRSPRGSNPGAPASLFLSACWAEAYLVGVRPRCRAAAVPAQPIKYVCLLHEVRPPHAESVFTMPPARSNVPPPVCSAVLPPVVQRSSSVPWRYPASLVLVVRNPATTQNEMPGAQWRNGAPAQYLFGDMRVLSRTTVRETAAGTGV